MRKSILALGAFGILSFASCGGGSGNIAQKWQVLYEDNTAQRDSFYNAQMEAIDTLTQFPADFLEMQKEMKQMHPDTLALMDPEMVQVLSISDLSAFKAKMKESALKAKKADDSAVTNNKAIYDFRKDNVIKMYATGNDYSDSSTMYKADLKKKKVYLYANPAVVKDEMAKDTVVFDILHLSDDSLSLKIDPNSKGVQQPDMKPMNFKAYKEDKKKK